MVSLVKNGTRILRSEMGRLINYSDGPGVSKATVYLGLAA